MPKKFNAIEIDGLATNYLAGEWIKSHEHDVHQIIHASAGTLRVLSETASWVVPPGRAIWMPKNRRHSIHCYTAVKMRTVYIRGSSPTLPKDYTVWAVSPLMREILVRIAISPNPRGIEHLKALLFSEIEIIEKQPLVLRLPVDARLRRLAHAISADPADKYSLADWAKILGLSERSLIRKFNAETGMTFRIWRRQARLLSSIERLAAGESVTSVSYAIGYDSVSAFIASFRECFGETPGRYINSDNSSSK
jgi:AraC-like DNA-binding protein